MNPSDETAIAVKDAIITDPVVVVENAVASLTVVAAVAAAGTAAKHGGPGRFFSEHPETQGENPD